MLLLYAYCSIYRAHIKILVTRADGEQKPEGQTINQLRIFSLVFCGLQCGAKPCAANITKEQRGHREFAQTLAPSLLSVFVEEEDTMVS